MPSRADVDQMLAQGRFEQLRLLCEEAAQQRPLASHEDMGLGVARLCLGMTLPAIAPLRRACDDPDNAYWGHYWLGRAYEAAGDLVKASRSFRTAHDAASVPENIAAFVRATLSYLGASGATVAFRAELAGQLADFWAKRDAIIHPSTTDGLSRQLGDIAESLARLEERQRDAEIVHARERVAWSRPFELRTDDPVALSSDDHLQPRGTLNDNTRSPRFVAACERVFGRKVKALDLGCAGGGLVRDFLLMGHRAFGLEGSDASLVRQRAEWRLIPDHLKTCDVTKPFEVRDADAVPAGFDIISAWEVLEHLPAETLAIFFANVRRHLSVDGMFVASVALFEDYDPATGARWHVTLQPRDWWHLRLREAGLEPVASPFQPQDFARGVGNGPHDWDALANPDMGFHIVARLPK